MWKRKKVKVVPRAKTSRVQEKEEYIRVYVTAPAHRGRANKAIIDALAKHYRVKKRDVRILKGEKSREKLVEIRESLAHP